MGRLLLIAACAGLLALAAGFWGFADHVRGPETPPAPPRAQAIVALTGGSIERLETGVRLLREGYGDRLLISGVNRIVTDEELFEAMHAPPELAACCIDIGRAAEDTLGNASETAAWAREHAFSEIILVTDDYHMPRSQTELALALPNAEIHPYPVRTRWTNPAIWRSDAAATMRLLAEYLKFLTIRGREAVIGLGQGEEGQSDAPQESAPSP